MVVSERRQESNTPMNKSHGRSKRCGLGLDQVMFFGGGDGLGAAVNLEFLQDGMHVEFHGPFGDDQRLGDLAVRVAGRNQAQDFRFAHSQRVDQSTL